MTFIVRGSRRPAPLEILRISEAGVADLLVGCAWPYGEQLGTIGAFGRALDKAQQSALQELASGIDPGGAVEDQLGDIVAELDVAVGPRSLYLSWQPAFVPPELTPFAEALATLSRDLRKSPHAALTLQIRRDPLRLELVHRGDAPFHFYGLGERDLGATMEVHLGGPTQLEDIPGLLHQPIASLTDPPQARIDDSGLVELRPGEVLALPLDASAVVETALVRICYPRHDDGEWFADEGWAVATPLQDIWDQSRSGTTA